MMTMTDLAHMETAEVYARLSKAKKLKVGAIVVKDNRVVSIGYNGTPVGWDNTCEDEIHTVEECYIDMGGPSFPIGSVSYKTRPEVIHAEANAIAKLARSSESGLNASMYISHAPCYECAKLIHNAGISKVFYRKHYRNEDGLNFLSKCNIEVEKI